MSHVAVDKLCAVGKLCGSWQPVWQLASSIPLASYIPLASCIPPASCVAVGKLCGRGQALGGFGRSLASDPGVGAGSVWPAAGLAGWCVGVSWENVGLSLVSFNDHTQDLHKVR